MQVTQNSGQPGSSQTIRIRGLAHQLGSTVHSRRHSSGGIDYLNPSDIESISIWSVSRPFTVRVVPMGLC